MTERKGDTIIGDSWDELQVDVPASKYASANNLKIRMCPECKAQNKKRPNDYSLSIIPIEGKGKCHKCGTSFIVRKKPEVTPQYAPPSRKNLTKLSVKGLGLFTDRHISQEAVVRHKIVERKGSIAFPYMLNGECVNIKFRNIEDKGFSQSPNGLHVMYNHDNCKECMDSSGDFSIVVVEGEFDSLAYETAGVHCSVSVDSGAPNPNDKIEKKLECITNSFELFEQAELIYIAVDNDENGKRLEQELIRRLAFDKIRLVNFGKHKDANEFLRWEGREALAATLKKAKQLKMEGIFTVEDIEDKLFDMYNNGLPKGQTTHFPSIDKHWKIREGEVTIFTGYNNEGKSNILHNILIIKAMADEWPSGLYTPENYPLEEWFEDAIHTYIGKSADIDFGGRMSGEEFKEGIDFLRSKFFLVQPEHSSSVDALFERFDYLVRKHGIRVIVIDPYNQVEHLFQGGETIDLYVSRFMGRLKKFAVSRRVAVILVAHQNPPKTRDANGNYPEPDIYTIKGGGTFADKADNVVSIWRPFRRSDESNPLVRWISGKIKKKKLTGIVGECDLAYDWKSNRYLDELLGGKSPLDVRLALVEEVRKQQYETKSLFE